MDAPSTNGSAARADLDFWRELAGGDDDCARDLLKLFLEDTSAQISVMVSALAAGRSDELARAAHTCAGSSSTCGVDTLALLFRQLEQQARVNRLDGSSHTLPLIVEAFDRVHVRLTKAMAASSPETLEERT